MNRKLNKPIADNRSIDIDDEYAVELWMKELNVSHARLKAAVRIAGTGVLDVKRQLTKPKT